MLKADQTGAALQIQLCVGTENLGCCLSFTPLNITHPAVPLLKTAVQCIQRGTEKEREKRGRQKESERKQGKGMRDCFSIFYTKQDR